MEPRMITIEHSNSNNNHGNNNSNYHFQNNHYTSESNLSDMNNNKFPQLGGYEVHSSSRRQTPMSAQETAHSQNVNSYYDYGNNSRVTEEQEKHHQNKTQTTTTSTTVKPLQSYLMDDDEHLPLESHQVFQPVNNGPYAKQTSVELETQPNSYSIRVEHHQQTSNWSNLDVYLHIFLTFYFGHFAAMLFFDGILRNIATLYVMDQSVGSAAVYVIHIIFSIGFLAFTVWFMTICWRWWRHKSIVPSRTDSENVEIDYTQRPVRPRAKKATAHTHVFVSACILIIGFCVFLALGCIDLAYKRDKVYNSDFFKQYNKSLYFADMIVFIFRLVFWLVGIVATLFLSREVLYKYCCPSKRIKINKERPTTVYEVQG